MMKMKKEKLFVSLIMVLVVILMVGTVNSFATELTVSVDDEETEAVENKAANTIGATIKASNTAKKTNTTKNTVTKNTANTANKVTNKVTNKVNNTANKVSNYANKTETSSLPYAGSDSTIILVVAALGISAVYAYKKVVDYNI